MASLFASGAGGSECVGTGLDCPCIVLLEEEAGLQVEVVLLGNGIGELDGGFVVRPVRANVCQVEADAASDGGEKVFAAEAVLHEVVIGNGSINHGFAQCACLEVVAEGGEFVDVGGKTSKQAVGIGVAKFDLVT